MPRSSQSQGGRASGAGSRSGGGTGASQRSSQGGRASGSGSGGGQRSSGSGSGGGHQRSSQGSRTSGSGTGGGQRTSQKHREFVSEPMGGKQVTHLPGIGETLGVRLAAQGYDKASGVLGQYLVMQGDKQEFTTWMKETTSANSKQANDCYDGLNKWTQEFL